MYKPFLWLIYCPTKKSTIHFRINTSNILSQPNWLPSSIKFLLERLMIESAITRALDFM